GPGVRVLRAPCMGACDRAPVIAVGHVQVPQASPDDVAAAVAEGGHTHAYRGGKDVAAYQAEGGYALLKSCLAGERTRDDIINAVRDAGLRGPRGLRFPNEPQSTVVRHEP